MQGGPGTKVKEFRARHSLTQVALADRLDMTARQIKRYENGQTDVPHVVMLALAELDRRLSSTSGQID